jgi:hypothetical protein
MHIPPHLILPQDMIDIIDHGPPDPGPAPGEAVAAEYESYRDGPKTLRMHMVDAKHAMEVEPERYKLPISAEATVEQPAPAVTDFIEDDDLE